MEILSVLIESWTLHGIPTNFFRAGTRKFPCSVKQISLAHMKAAWTVFKQLQIGR